MKTSVFGPRGIDDSIRGDLELFFKLSESDTDKFANWLSESARPIPLTWSEVERLSDGTALQPGETNRVLILLRFLLTNWTAFDESQEGIGADMVAAGYTKEQADKVLALLSRLKNVRERVYRSSLRTSYETYGLPTIDDVNLFWDVRPIFESTAYDSVRNPGDAEKLITHTNVLIFEIQASPERGAIRSTAFQLSEDEFDRLHQAFEKAKRQLEVVKKKFT